MDSKSFYLMCANKCNTTQKQIKSIVDAIKDVIIESLCCGEDVRISGVGKFYLKVCPERTFLNNFTGNVEKVDKRFKVCFKCSKKLCDEIK